MADVTPDAAVVDRVKSLAAAGERPALTDAEVITAIRNHPRLDADGRLADDPDWTQLWDVYAIVSELWGLKAGKVAGDFNFSADDGRYDKGAVMANCLAMEAHYGAKAAGSTQTGAYVDVDPLKGVVING